MTLRDTKREYVITIAVIANIEATKVVLTCDKEIHSITGTLFAGRDARIVSIENVLIEAAITPHMLLIQNDDKPGMIGALGTALANAGVNIADFRLGRVAEGQKAVALVSTDTGVNDELFKTLKAIPQIRTIQRLSF